jgi:uncharacterized circularly permuted ATP-grasp superfamily protein/uncharacterized alpha-E superfamily protein
MVSSLLERSGGSGPRGTGPTSAFDEMVTGTRAVRAPWQPLFSALSQLGPGGIADRAERARLQLEEDGVTFNLYEAADAPARPRGSARLTGPQRPWALDPLPLIIGAQEWNAIAAGVAQRARLLDRVLADLYGPQKLLAERHYPPALVFGSPDFLRPCRNAVQPRPTAFLQNYACDLARGPDGIWRVIADRAQGPVGAAYALQNRRVLTRVMSEAFRATRVRPLAGFFDAWQSDLQGRAPGERDNPRMVLLTPGPFNEAYFEHVYLARQLGATLVEGADLTARDGRVYLKTLGGLLPVDVVLRRVDGNWCDPLELRGDSGLGVVGLVDAVREGSVAIANALGSGAVDAPAVAAFLPRLAEHVLGEELTLPSIATWWCGQSYALKEVLERLPTLAIRAALTPASDTINPSELSAAEQAELVTRLRLRPQAYAAQERIVPSVSPGLGASGLEPQSVVLRVFATASRGNYVVLPGGIARVPAGNDPLRAGLQRGGINKDVWVEADEPGAATASPLPGRQRIVIRRTVGELPSRVADNLFWLGRNVERLDNGGRLLRAGLQRVVAGFGGPREFVETAAVIRVLARCGVFGADVAAALPDGLLPAQALIHAFAPGKPMDQTFQKIERLAASVRDRFSVDMWRTINHLLGDLRGRLDWAGGNADRMLDLLDDLVRVSSALSGMASENMTRGSGWRFLDMGRRVERAIYVARVLLGVGDTAAANWDASLHLALELCDSTITYRTRYLAALQAAPVLDLLLLDDTNPQSLAFQLAAVRQHLLELPARNAGPVGRETLVPLDVIGEAVALFDRDDLRGAAITESIEEMRAQLTRTEAALQTFSDEITRAYFSHVQPARAFGYR